jgi:thiamine-phosphate pyrophosphorylase
VGLPRLYPILDVDMAERHGHDLVALAQGFARLGIDLLQLRAKRLPAGEFLALSKRIRAALPPAVRLIINDRVDVARLAGAAGAHLGQDDLPAAEAFNLLPHGSVVGFSTHSLQQLQQAVAAEPLPSYIAIGPIFTTQTKENPEAVIGVEAIRRARQIYRGPLVAIGGITGENCELVWQAGADSVAVIAGLLATTDPVATAASWLGQ